MANSEASIDMIMTMINQINTTQSQIRELKQRPTATVPRTSQNKTLNLGLFSFVTLGGGRVLRAPPPPCVSPKELTQ